jgi:single-stranded-DNA-specific exonuclease
MAAGLKINAENLERFQDRFEETVRQMTVADNFIPALFIDGELDFDDITPELLDGIASLMPFGAQNPEPLFAACDVHVRTASIVGKNHRRMVLGQPRSKTGQSIQAIHFRIDPEKPQHPAMEQLVFRLRWNRWNGKKSVQILVEET